MGGSAEDYIAARSIGAPADYLDRETGPIFPDAANPWTLSALGGGTARFAGIFLRMRESDFRRTTGEHPDADLDPAWPIRYEHLRPWYELVEHRYGVARSSVGDVCAPPTGRPVLPPHKLSPEARLLVRGTPDVPFFPTPVAVNSVPYRGRPACQYSSLCNENVCPSGARADPLRELLTPRLPGSLKIRTDSYVTRMRTDSEGSSTASAEWVDLTTGERHATRARAFILAANAVQSSALLLRSPTPRSPVGLGNEHDMVGRGLCLKTAGYLTARVAPTESMGKSLFSTVCTTAFYEHLPSGRLGGLIYEARLTAQSGPDWRLHCVTADTVRRGNRVRLGTVHRSGRLCGQPKAMMQYHPSPDDSSRLGELLDVAGAMARRAGADRLRPSRVDNHLGAAHLLGGCRAGEDPTTSVVDRDGRLHTSTNTYVVDGSYFPSPSAVNPTMTIMANAMRIADQVLS